jgi:HEAT repeat protein
MPKKHLPPDDAFVISKFLRKLEANRFRTNEDALAALKVLKEQGVKVEAELLRALSRVDEHVQFEITIMLTMLPGVYPIEPLIPLLDQDRRYFRLEVMHLIARSRDKRVVDIMLDILDHDNSMMRVAAINNLYRPYAEKAIPRIKLALHDEEWEVRRAAVEWLAAVEHLDSVEFLIPMLEDKNAHVRQAAAEELGKLGDKRALFALSWMEQNDTANKRNYGPDLKRTAARAIKKIKQKYEPEVEWVLVEAGKEEEEG